MRTSSCRCLLLPLSGSERRQQVETAMELVGLSDRMWHRPGQLSGGQQQRVGIARAIVTDPELIVADEPTGDLDAKSAEEILDLLDELRAGLEKTIILVTHDPRAARRTDRILRLEKGVLVDGIARDEGALTTEHARSTLRVGPQGTDAPRPDATQSVAPSRSHAERGNEN